MKNTGKVILDKHKCLSCGYGRWFYNSNGIIDCSYCEDELTAGSEKELDISYRRIKSKAVKNGKVRVV